MTTAPTGSYLEVAPGVELYYEEHGAGPPIVFVPGWTFTTEVFAHQVAHFAQTHRVIVVDPRSQGRSSKAVHGNDYVTHGADLARLFAALELRDAVLVGWSTGSLDALGYVQQAGTGALRALVGIDMSPKPLSVSADDWVESPLDERPRAPGQARPGARPTDPSEEAPMSDDERWDLTLPAGARVVPLAEQLSAAAPEGALGASPTPGGAEIYGGSDLHAYMSADGTLFVVYCGERGPGFKFGTYVLRYWPDGRREWVELGAFTEGRAGVVREPDGLFLAWPLPGGRSWERVKVPGYVTPGWPSSGQSVVAPVAITTTPAPAQFAGTDQAARDQLAALKKQLAALTSKVAQLEARPAAAPAPDVGQIRDVIWNLPTVVDRIYAELAADNQGLVEQVERIVRRALDREAGPAQG